MSSQIDSGMIKSEAGPNNDGAALIHNNKGGSSQLDNESLEELNKARMMWSLDKLIELYLIYDGVGKNHTTD